MTDSTIIFEVSSRGVASITLNRPDIHNAFDDVIINQLIDVLDRISDNSDVRVVVLRANGKSFSAGADLNWMKRMVNNTLEENYEDARRLALLMEKLLNLRCPTIALVQGAAIGGGVGLVSCCDIAIASEKAKFQLSEVRIGLTPAAISPYVVTAIGSRTAHRYFLTAERIGADKAKEIGLVHEVVEPDKLDDACDDIVNNLLLNSPAAVASAKKLVKRVSKGEIDNEMVEYTVKNISEIRVSDEGQEGLSAFLEKRKPKWAK